MSSGNTSSLLALAKLERRKEARKPQLKNASSLTNFKDKTAYALLQREEQNGKRSRLESLLTQQFIGKYGTKQPTSSINNFIKSTVSDFVYSYDNVKVAESMIESLEAQIREITVGMKSKSAFEKEKMQLGQAASRRGSRQDDGSDNSDSFSGTHAGNSRPEAQPSWAMLNAVLAEEAETTELKKREKAEQDKIKFRLELDKQRETVRERNSFVSLEKKSAFEMVKQAKETYEADQARLKERNSARFVVERELRLKQIADNQTIREKERQLQILQEKMDMARSRRLAEEEQELVKLKKEEQKRAQDRLVEENEINKAVKAEALKKQWEYEAKLNRDYEEKMAREEKARQDAFTARVEALKKAERGFAHIAGAKAEQDAFNQQKVMEEIEKKYKSDAEKEIAKKEKQRESIEQSRAFNLTLVERKQRLVAEERQRDIEMRKKMEIDSAIDQEKSRLKAEEKRLRMQELKAKLDEQVSFRHEQGSFTKGAGLSSLELDMNKSIIKKIESDPMLAKKVMLKMQPPPSKPTVGGKFI